MNTSERSCREPRHVEPGLGQLPGVGRAANEQQVHLAQGVGHPVQTLLGRAGHQLNPRTSCLERAMSVAKRQPWPLAGRPGLEQINGREMDFLGRMELGGQPDHRERTRHGANPDLHDPTGLVTADGLVNHTICCWLGKIEQIEKLQAAQAGQGGPPWQKP